MSRHFIISVESETAAIVITSGRDLQASDLIDVLNNHLRFPRDVPPTWDIKPTTGVAYSFNAEGDFNNGDWYEEWTVTYEEPMVYTLNS